MILGFVGVVFTAAAIRSIAVSEATGRQTMRQLGLVILLLIIFGSEIAAGIVLLTGSAKTGAERVIGYALVTSLLVGVARAWELVGERGTGLLASVAELTGRRYFQGGISGGVPDNPTGQTGGSGTAGGGPDPGSGQTPGGNGHSSPS
jgi:hypothetical protein